MSTPGTPNQTLYVRNLNEKVKREGACLSLAHGKDARGRVRARMDGGGWRATDGWMDGWIGAMERALRRIRIEIALRDAHALPLPLRSFYPARALCPQS